MDLPKFTPAPPPSVDTPVGLRVVYDPPPRCAACDDVAWSRDGVTGLCRACWRCVVLGPESRGAPVADLSVARELQAVPRLTDEAGGAGIALDVGLVPPRTKGRP